MAMSISTRSEAEESHQEKSMPWLPNEILVMIFKMALREDDPMNRLFWTIRGDGEEQPHLADLMMITPDWSWYHNRIQIREDQILESEASLSRRYETYQAIRGSRICNLLLVAPFVRRLVEREYVFLRPFPDTTAADAVAPRPGFWIHPEHDVFHFFDYFTNISPRSPFPWSRARHLVESFSRGHSMDTMCQLELLLFHYGEALFAFMPGLRTVSLLYTPEIDEYWSWRRRDPNNPVIATREDLRQVAVDIAFEDQGSLGGPPSATTRASNVTESDYRVANLLKWIRPRGISLVELMHCRQLSTES